MKKIAGALLGSLLLAGSTLPAMAASSPYQFRSTSIQVSTPSGEKYITAENFAYQGTTYVPIYYLIEAMHYAGASASWNGSTKTFTFNDPFASDNVLPAKSGNVNLLLNSVDSPFHASRIVARDPQSGVLTTYMKLYDLQLILTAYGINSTWDGSVTPNTWKLPKFYDPIPQSSQILGTTSTAIYYLIGGYGGSFQGLKFDGVPFFANAYYVISVSFGNVMQSQKFLTKPTVLTENGNVVVYGAHNIAVVPTSGVGVYFTYVSLPIPTQTIDSLQYIAAGTNPNLQTDDPALQVTASDGTVYYFDSSNGQFLTPTSTLAN